MFVTEIMINRKPGGNGAHNDTAKEKPKRGKVIAVGDGRRLENGERAPFSVKKGDEVIFTSYAGTEIKIDGEEVLILSEDDVLAIVD